MEKIRIALLGHRFMGRAHSNAWSQVSKFFDTPYEPELQVVCGREVPEVKAFARRWGWREVETDWTKIMERKDIDVIDIALPTHLHAETAIAAAESGKHIFCEKPFCNTLAQAEAMLAAAEKAGVVHYLNHNYRRCPAVHLARQLIEAGELGRILHWRGAYQQSWLLDPRHPIDWKLRRMTAAAGPLWDLGSHAVDLAHYLAGDFASVTCQTTQFTRERPLAEDPARKGEVEVECSALMLAEFKNGAQGTIETTRYASGRRNRHTFEIYGTGGALCWDMEDMNRLKFYSEKDAQAVAGFRDIMVNEAVHDYAKNWWPPGHIIGYEHGFVHAAADFLDAIANRGGIAPDFADGVKIIRVLEAALDSASQGRRIAMGS